MLDITRFGATGNGTTDDLPAINAAIAELPAGQATLFAPPGLYRMDGVPDQIAGRHVSIVGAGAAVSTFLCEAGEGFDIDLQKAGSELVDYGYRFNISGIGFRTVLANTGHAIKLRGTHAGGKVDVCNRINDVGIFGESNSYSFHTGIEVLECGQVSFSDIKADGRHAGGEAGGPVVLIDGGDNSNNFFFTNCMFTWYNSAVKLASSIGTSNYPPEGLHMLNCDTVACVRGVDTYDLNGYSGASSEGLQVANCHFATTEAAIGGYLVQALITNNLFYDRPGSSDTYSHIELLGNGFEDSTQNLISANEFHNAKSTNKTQVRIGAGGAGTVSYTTVQNNLFNGPSTAVSVHVGVNSSRTVTKNNRCIGGISSVQDSGSNTGVGGRFSRRYVSSDIPIGHSTNHVVVFDAEAGDPDDLMSGAYITIPEGITRIRIKGSVMFSGNSNGERSVVLEQNSGGGFTGNYPFRPGVKSSASSVGGSMQMCFESAVLDVAAGYVYQMVCGQTSGTNLNLQANRTWWEVEVIE